MAGRLAIVLGAMLALKLVARFTLIGAFTVNAIQFFAIVDAVVALLAAPFVAAGSPRPARSAARRRAMMSAALLIVALWMMNVLLQAPLFLGRASDALEAALLVVTVGFGNAMLGGPIIGPLAGLVLWLLGSGAAWAWLLMRLPKESPKTGAKRPGKSPGGVAGGPASRPDQGRGRVPAGAPGRSRAERRPPR